MIKNIRMHFLLYIGVLLILVALIGDEIYKHNELKLKEKFKENQYETLSNYFTTDEKNIIMVGRDGDGYLVKTNKKSYTVVFNKDGKKIEKIIEN